MVRDHLARAVEYIAKGESWYAKAADEILAEREENDTSWREIAERVGKSSRWCRTIVAWRTSGEPEADVDWQRGSHGTKAELEAFATKLLSSPSEAEKLLASLPEETKASLAKAVVRNPGVREHVEHEQRQQHAATRSDPTDVREPKFPLLHRIEADRLRLQADAELMAGHWHDGRHDVSDTELRLVRDSMAQAVMTVEEVITVALRAEARGVEDPT